MGAGYMVTAFRSNDTVKVRLPAGGGGGFHDGQQTKTPNPNALDVTRTLVMSLQFRWRLKGIYSRDLAAQMEGAEGGPH